MQSDSKDMVDQEEHYRNHLRDQALEVEEEERCHAKFDDDTHQSQ